MKEVVLGLGQQKSLWSVVQQADEQLRTIHGSPRRMIVRSRGIEIEASRPRFEGDFESFKVRFPQPSRALRDSLGAFAARCPVACEVGDAEGTLVLGCAAPSAGQVDKLHEACDALSETYPAARGLADPRRGVPDRPDQPRGPLPGHDPLQGQRHPPLPRAAPVFRVDGAMRRVQSFEPLSSEQILSMIETIASEKHFREFTERQQCSFIYHQLGLGYARVSAFCKAGVPHCTMRFLPEKIPSFEELNIPRAAMERLANLHFGLVLVTGMTGSGKSTTVASLIDWINANRSLHILSIEEPVEYVHTGKKSIVSQRDVGEDIGSFHDAVRGALRHDPDVIVIGEMRDPDTIRSAINAAATGHLVISTLHSGTAYEVINRVVSFFDPVERDLVKLQLRDALKCVICQRLLPKIGGGRLPALECLFNDTKAISDSDPLGQHHRREGRDAAGCLALVHLRGLPLRPLQEGHHHPGDRPRQRLRAGDLRPDEAGDLLPAAAQLDAPPLTRPRRPVGGPRIAGRGGRGCRAACRELAGGGARSGAITGPARSSRSSQSPARTWRAVPGRAPATRPAISRRSPSIWASSNTPEPVSATSMAWVSATADRHRAGSRPVGTSAARGSTAGATREAPNSARAR